MAARWLVGGVATLTLALAACAGNDGSTGSQASPAPSPQPTTRTATPRDVQPPRVTSPRVVRTIASGLAVPWGVTFLPDGTALVGERDTTRVLAIHGKQVREVGRLSLASPQGEAGLLGLAVSPSYDDDHLVYAYVSTSDDNRVVRMTYAGERLGT